MPTRSYSFAVADWSPQATLLGYTVLTYTISWTLWSIWAVSETGTTLTGTVLFMLGVLEPFATSAIPVRVSDRSVRTWFRGIFAHRIPIRYYVLALTKPIALLLGAAAVHVVFFDGVSPNSAT